MHMNKSKTKSPKKIILEKKICMEIKTIIILSWNNYENVAQQHVLDTLLRSHHAFHASVFLNNSKYIKKFNIRLTSYKWLNDFLPFNIMFCIVVIFTWNLQRQFIIIIIVSSTTFTIWSEVKWSSKKGTSNIKIILTIRVDVYWILITCIFVLYLIL